MKFLSTLRVLSITVLAVSLSGCIAPRSKFYLPSQSEATYFGRVNKAVMPSDIRNNVEQYSGEEVHWVGIIRGHEIIDKDSTKIIEIEIDQKYYDYVLDYSIQREKMFLSPKGEGIFYLDLFVDAGISEDELKRIIDQLSIKNLIFAYGVVQGLKQGKPAVKALYYVIHDESVYATNIFSYEYAKDENGKVILGSSGFPSLTNHEVFQTPLFGRNQSKIDK